MCICGDCGGPRRSTSLGLGTTRFNRGLSRSGLSVCLSNHFHLPVFHMLHNTKVRLSCVYFVCISTINCVVKDNVLEPQLESENMISLKFIPFVQGLCVSDTQPSLLLPFIPLKPTTFIFPLCDLISTFLVKP